MKAKLTPYLLIAAAVLFVASASTVWAGSKDKCGMHGHQAAATDKHQSTEGSDDGHQMESMKNTGHMDKMKHMGHDTHMMDMSAPHGGTLKTVGDYELETVFTESDVRLYVSRTDDQAPKLDDLKATATITGTDGQSQTVEFDVATVADDPMSSHRHMAMRPERASEYLSAPFTFGTMPDEAVTVTFSVAGAGDEMVEWNQPFAMTPLFGAACPMHPEQASLTGGECSICGGMEMQPARVVYGCCPGCPDMRSTSPQTCSKCGMEMKLKSVGSIDIDELETASPRHPNHAG